MFSGRLRISVAEESRRKTGAARVLAAAKAFLPTIPPQLIMTEPTEEGGVDTWTGTPNTNTNTTMIMKSAEEMKNLKPRRRKKVEWDQAEFFEAGKWE